MRRAVWALAMTVSLISVLAVPTEGPADAQVDESALGGTVWFDEDRDGIIDVDEAGLAGVRVNVWTALPEGSPDTLVQRTTTDVDGKWSFDTPTGDYIVQWVTPDGYELTRGPESAADPSGLSDVVTVQADQPASVNTGFVLPGDPADPGNSAPVQLHGIVWSDGNGNGFVDGGEPGIDGVQVTILQASGDDELAPITVAGTLTQFGGRWSYSVPPGNYIVRWNTPPDFVPSRLGGDNDLFESEPGTPTIWQSRPFTVEPDSEQPSIDAAYRSVDAGPPSTGLGGFVWLDLNGDAFIDPDEPGIADARVNIWTADAEGVPEVVAQIVETDADGNWSTSTLDAGRYLVQWIIPDDTVPSVQIAGENNDSDGDLVSLSQAFSLEPAIPLTLDAGFVPTVQVNATIWHDLDEDGIRQAGEPAISNALVAVGIAGGDPFIDDATTGADGAASLTVWPGEFEVAAARVGYELPADFDGSLTIAPGQSTVEVSIGLVALRSTTLSFTGWIVDASQNVQGVAVLDVAESPDLPGSLTVFAVPPVEPIPRTLELEAGTYVVRYSPEDSQLPDVGGYRPTSIDCDQATAGNSPEPGVYVVQVPLGVQAECRITLEAPADPVADLTIVNASTSDPASTAPRYSIDGEEVEAVQPGEEVTTVLPINGSYTLVQELADVADTVSVECTGALSYSWTTRSVSAQSHAQVEVEVGSEPVSCEFINEARELGDVNCDGQVSILDASIIAQHAVGLRDEHSPCPIAPGTGMIHLVAADTNRDQVVDILDAFRIAQCAVGLTNTFCPAEP